MPIHRREGLRRVHQARRSFMATSRGQKAESLHRVLTIILAEYSHRSITAPGGEELPVRAKGNGLGRDVAVAIGCQQVAAVRIPKFHYAIQAAGGQCFGAKVGRKCDAPDIRIAGLATDFTSRPLPASQIRTILSQPTDASRFPSRWNAKARTGPSCPSRGNFGVSDLPFQSRTVLSLPADARVSPSGDRAIAFTSPGCVTSTLGFAASSGHRHSPPSAARRVKI